ncbi:MAG: glutamine--fructose-6-phosphate transaminase (isomerizing) [Candidatus Micrarchaeota archaeon]
MVDEVSASQQFTSLDGITAIGHCLHPDTYVQLSDGRVCKIKDIAENDEVCTLDFGSLHFKKQNCSFLEHRSPAELYEIKTPVNSIICTGEHRMFVFEDQKIIDKKAKDLKTGDLMVCAKRIDLDGSLQPLRSVPAKRYYSYGRDVVDDFKAFLKKNGMARREFAASSGLDESILAHFINMDRNLEEAFLEKICSSTGISRGRFKPVYSIHGKDITLPEKTSMELLQFLGYLIGDGNVKKRCIRFKDARKDILESYAALAKSLFNLKSRIVKLPEANAYMLEMNSKFVCDWLRENFPEICMPWEKKSIPVFLGKTSKNEIAGLLRGLFDAEAACGMRSRQIMISMRNQQIIRTVQILLLRFGIVASFSVNPTKWGPSYRLQISNFNGISAFMKSIGFTSCEKQEKAKTILSSLRPGISFSYKSVPLTKGEISSVFEIKSRSLRPKDAFFTEMGVLQFMDELEEDSEAFRALSRFLESDVISQPISEIRKFASDTEKVYDISVPGTENFIANGLVSHNSRWATHGAPSMANAHPHTDCTGKIAIVHNGVIENYRELREELKKKGHRFSSETDSEVFAHLAEEEKKDGKDTFSAFLSSLKKLKGSFAIALLSQGERKLYAARKNSPLVIGFGKDGSFAASDMTAMLAHTKTFVPLGELEAAILRPESIKFYSLEGNEIQKKPMTVNWSAEMAEKGGRPHFMLKEIYEQKHCVTDSLATDVSRAHSLLSRFKKLHITACGTSHHAALVFRHLSQKCLGKGCDAIIASEYPFVANPDSETLAIAISQSGETADTMRALEYAKKEGARILALTNVVGSSITRIADEVVYLNSGPEVSVAATKTFTSQLAVIYKLLFPGWDFSGIPGLISSSLGKEEEIRRMAEKLKGRQNLFFLGRGLSLPIAMEGALKFKEISYRHAEAYPGGELKHGPLSLIEEGVPVIALAPDDESVYKMLGNIKEVRARGGFVISLTDSREIAEESDVSIAIPKTDPLFCPFALVAPLQLLAYHASVGAGINPDRPRHLAKSVTVE